MHRFKYYLRVRYSECDAQKLVFNSRYSDYLNLAATEFLRTVGWDQECECQVVKQTIEWKSSGRYDDVLELSVAATNLGNTSFALGSQIRIAGTEKVIASGETVYVLLDGQTMQKKPLPIEFRAALETGASGARTDHAGYFSGTDYQAAIGG